VLAFNGPAAPDAERRIAAALNSTGFGGVDPGSTAGPAGAVDGLLALKEELNAPRALADYGFTEDSIAEAADAILPSVPPSNPRPVTAPDLRALLRAAWSGSDPRTAF